MPTDRACIAAGTVVEVKQDDGKWLRGKLVAPSLAHALIPFRSRFSLAMCHQLSLKRRQVGRPKSSKPNKYTINFGPKDDLEIGCAHSPRAGSGGRGGEGCYRM